MIRCEAGDARHDLDRGQNHVGGPALGLELQAPERNVDPLHLARKLGQSALLERDAY